MTALESNIRKTLKFYGETDPRFLKIMTERVVKAIDKNLEAGIIDSVNDKVIDYLCYHVIDSYCM